MLLSLQTRLRQSLDQIDDSGAHALLLDLQECPNELGSLPWRNGARARRGGEISFQKHFVLPFSRISHIDHLSSVKMGAPHHPLGP
jgi:hypothetical protein